MQTYRKYSKKRNVYPIQEEPVYTEYIPTKYVKRLISVPDYVNEYLEKNVSNVSAYLVEMAIKDMNIKKPNGDFSGYNKENINDWFE